MEYDKAIINVDTFSGHGVIVICAPTGILCTAQVAGQACCHPCIEGFPIDLHCDEGFYDALNEFNDCSWGCWCSGGLHDGNETGYESDSVEYLNNYAKAIDEFLSKNVNDKNSRLSFFEFDYFEFDYERIKELTEGWWPVLIRFHNYETKFKGYLHFGNCD